MGFIKSFEKFDQSPRSILIIVDVQKSFKDFFSNNYLKSLKEYSNNFDDVYQIIDNHHKGKNVDGDYLYDEDHKAEGNDDLYTFPNQKEVIEKRYNYDVDVDFYKKILSDKTYNEIKSKENNLKKGQYFPTTEGTVIIYIGNRHNWFHVPKKLYEIFEELRQAQTTDSTITIVGGANGECLEDIITTCNSLGLKIQKNKHFIYSADKCPIK